MQFFLKRQLFWGSFQRADYKITNIRKCADASALVESIRKTKFIEVDARLLRCVKFSRQIKQPVTLSSLSYHALKILDDF